MFSSQAKKKSRTGYFQPQTDAEQKVRSCDVEGCENLGEYRAPKSAKDLRSYFWFCLEHVREYNSKWNFFGNFSYEEMEEEYRQTTTWERPTWPLGGWRNRSMDDPFVLINEKLSQKKSQKQHEKEQKLNAQVHEALSLLNLEFPFDQSALKKRYKALVKEHHPDAHGGSKEKEELLKQINDAYTTLKKFIK